jgi:DNA-binding NtrC family response regulator
MMERQRILVVEDDPSMGRAMLRILHVFQVTLCGSVDEARPLLRTETWNAIVSDVQLGEESGLDLFEEVVAVRPELAERYLFVSGAACLPEMAARLQRTGAPYFQKPYDLDEFREALVAILVAQRSG